MDSSEFINRMSEILWGNREVPEKILLLRVRDLIETERKYNLISNRHRIIETIDELKGVIEKIENE